MSKIYERAQELGEINHQITGGDCEGTLDEQFVFQPGYGKKRMWICDTCGQSMFDSELRNFCEEAESSFDIDNYDYYKEEN